MSDRNDIKRLAMDFLLDCALGQHEDLITAAIDKAYIDMAAHTMTIFDKEEYNAKWECRFKATGVIRKAITNYSKAISSFVVWHEKVIKDIKDTYDSRLNEGQAQKWLNMTIKYIFVLEEVLGKDDKRLKEANSFISNTSENDYYTPIDSYVLKAVGIRAVESWSNMGSEQYERVASMLGEEMDFLWELESWSEYADKYKQNAKDSYAAFLKKESEKHDISKL